MPSKTKKTTEKTAAKTTSRKGRKSAQNEVFDQVQAAQAVAEETPAEETQAEETQAEETQAVDATCVLCDEPDDGNHVCEPKDEEDERHLDDNAIDPSPVATDGPGNYDHEADEDAGQDDDGEPVDDDGEPKRTRYLRCDLTRADIDEKRVRREQLDDLIERLGEELSTHEAAVKSLKKRIDGVGAEGLALSKCIRDGYESRNVPCEERPCVGDDGKTKGMATVRLDTLERLEWRPLTASERQGRLFQ